MTADETRPTTIDPAARAAAEWWATKLQNPRFDNGDRSQTGATVSAMALMAYCPPTGEEVERFREALAASLTAEIRAGRGFAVIIGVDYGPDRILREALEAAGIHAGITALPWKTAMRIEADGEIVVGEGYGAPWKTIHPGAQDGASG